MQSIWFWRREYSVWSSTWMQDQGIPIIFLGLGLSKCTHLSSPVPPQCRSAFHFVFKSTVHKHFSTFLVFNSCETQYPCFWIMPMTWRGPEVDYCVTFSNRANFWLWHEPSLSNAPISTSLKTSSRLSLSQSSTLISQLLKRWNRSQHVLSLITTSLYVFESVLWASAACFFRIKHKN